MGVDMELRMEMRAEYTGFRDTADRDVMRMAWQTEDWKAVGGQSRCREGGLGWNRNKKNASSKVLGKKMMH